MMLVLRSLVFGILLLRAATGQDAASHAESDATWKAGRLFGAVGRALERNWPERRTKEEVVPSLVARYEPDARAAHDLDEERRIVAAMLGELHASHLALYSRFTYDTLMAAVFGHRTWSFGVELERRHGTFTVAAVHDGGPAAAAGLKVGDHLLAIDGVAPMRSRRLDLRSDDAALDDVPRHLLIAAEDAHTTLRIARGDDAEREVTIVAARIGLLDATRASARVIGVAGARIGYLHFWAIHEGGCASTLRRLLGNSFATVDAIVLDLRGRGGSAAEVQRIAGVVRKEVERKGTRFVALVDEESRSAKEVLAARLKSDHLAILVGRKTAGAVLPANFVHIDAGHVLMLPMSLDFDLGDGIEGVGIEPDVVVEVGVVEPDAGDPILLRGLEVAARHD